MKLTESDLYQIRKLIARLRLAETLIVENGNVELDITDLAMLWEVPWPGNNTLNNSTPSELFFHLKS